MADIGIIIQCSACGYSLAGLGAPGLMVRCPECGRDQVPRRVRPFPTVLQLLWRSIQLTLAFATAFNVLLLVSMWSGAPLVVFLLAVAGMVCFLCGIVAPIEVYTTTGREHDVSHAPYGWGFSVVVGGWVLNFLMCVVYIGAVCSLAAWLTA